MQREIPSKPTVNNPYRASPQVPYSQVKQCKTCEQSFGIFRHKYHCAHCGKVFCSSCAYRRTPLPIPTDNSPKRVCHHCFITIKAWSKDWNLLRKLPAAELVSYISSYGGSTSNCNRKSDLIRVIRRLHFPERRRRSTTSSNPSDPAVPNPIPSSLSEESQPSPNHRGFRHSMPSVSSSRNQWNPFTNPSPSGSPDPVTTSSQFSDPKRLRPLFAEEAAYIDALPIRQLKQILREQGISPAGCLMKQDLADKVKHAASAPGWKGKPLFRPKDLPSPPKDSWGFDERDRDLCKICFDHEMNAVFLECGHLLACLQCARKCKECPVCRIRLSRVVEIFRM